MFGEDLIAEQLAQVRETLAQVPESPAGQTEPIKTEASEGRIQVTLGTDGRFERIKMTLSALKDGPDALVEQLTLAVNAALDQRAAQTAPAGPVPDLAAVNERLTGLQDASLRQFQDMTAAIDGLMGRLREGR
jgi:DNA-binding protein YbaB